MISTFEKKYGIEMPVGYESFHPLRFMNFQMNRFYHEGYLRREDMESAAPKISDLGSWQREFTMIGEEAEKEGRILNAAFAYRAAEFFTYSTDPQKRDLSRRFITLFYEFFGDEEIERFRVPYQGSYLHALRLRPTGEKRGTVVLHGGGDSFVEEFISFVGLFVDRGYELIMFDGPGQGTSLHQYGHKMTHEWERPTAAILDYFQLDDVTLIGISLGGYLAPRAAAFEPRIKRVVAFDIIGDFLGSFLKAMNPKVRVMFKLLMALKARGLFNRMLQKASRKPDVWGQFFAWWMLQTYYMWGVKTPFEAFERMKNYNALAISPLIKQDVLLLAGENDIYTPYFDAQVKALTNARSVEGRIFTREEHAAEHCQIGNCKLALEYILNWMDKKEPLGNPPASVETVLASGAGVK